MLWPHCNLLKVRPPLVMSSRQVNYLPSPVVTLLHTDLKRHFPSTKRVKSPSRFIYPHHGQIKIRSKWRRGTKSDSGPNRFRDGKRGLVFKLVNTHSRIHRVFCYWSRMHTSGSMFSISSQNWDHSLHCLLHIWKRMHTGKLHVPDGTHEAVEEDV